MTRKRLDKCLQEKFPELSRNQIQALIAQGNVKVEGIVSKKPGVIFEDTCVFEVENSVPKFVCRAGFKLEHALAHFGVDVTGKVILDAGLSTGGFTDCLLQNGAKHVYGVDVGSDQVHEKIKNNSAVTVMEQTNLRYLTSVGELVDIVTLDLSFISVLKVMDSVNAILKPEGSLIVLIKPQFESSQDAIGRGGIIRDPKVHKEIVDSVIAAIVQYGYNFVGVTDSPITGTCGNKEFLGLFKKE